MTKQKRLLLALFISMTMSMLAVPVAVGQPPGADCRNLVAGRTYAHVFEGVINTELFPLPGVTGDIPNAGLGTIIFNRDGTVGGSTTLKIGPAVFVAPMVNATYSLAWDASKKPMMCTGTMKSDTPASPTGTENWQLVVSEMGNRVEIIHTDTGLIVGTTAFPLQRCKCSNHTLNSTYTYNAKAWSFPVPPPPPFPPFTPEELFNGFMPFAFSGAIVFKPHVSGATGVPGAPAGSSYLEGWDMVSLNGFITPRTYVGWYEVNADCSATMVLVDSLGNPPIHTSALILQGADTIDILNLDVPFVLSFVANRER